MINARTRPLYPCAAGSPIPKNSTPSPLRPNMSRRSAATSRNETQRRTHWREKSQSPLPEAHAQQADVAALEARRRDAQVGPEILHGRLADERHRLVVTGGKIVVPDAQRAVVVIGVVAQRQEL